MKANYVSSVVTYQILNYLIVCFGYSFFVANSSYIGLVFVLSLFTNALSGILFLIIYLSLLKINFGSFSYRIIVFVILGFFINQLSFSFIGRDLPVLDLLDTKNNGYMKGENMFFTMSSLISSAVVLAIKKNKLT